MPHVRLGAEVPGLTMLDFNPTPAERIADLRLRLIANGWQVVAVRTGGKAPTEKGWQGLVYDIDDLARLNTPSALNTGIATKALRILDIDIDEAADVALVRQAADEQFGETPLVRLRDGSPRLAMFYRAVHGQPTKRSIELPCGKLEILGAGQQVVAFGTHPSGASYDFEGDSPLEVTPGEIPDITEDQITRFFAWIGQHYGAKPANETNALDFNKAGSGFDLGEAIRKILSGSDYHDSLRDTAASLVSKGMPAEQAVAVLRGAMQAVETRDSRWAERYNDIERAVRSAAEKFAPSSMPIEQDLRLIPAREFMEGFEAPDYLIEGVVQRGMLYSLTAPTGHGKTAAAVLMACCLATGAAFAGHQTEASRVAFFAGENADDVRGRFILAGERMGLNLADSELYFFDRAFDITTVYDTVCDALRAIGGADQVFIDTAAAFFGGDDENSNAEQARYARLLRTLTRKDLGTNGQHGPCVTVLAHPTKNAGRDACIPRGGGAFVAEVDGNIRLWSSDKETAEMEPFHKFRGAPFEPIALQMERGTSDRLRDSKGRHIPYVIARAITEKEIEAAEERATRDEDRVLLAMHQNAGASIAHLCSLLGFISSGGKPQKSVMYRILDRLKNERLACIYRRKWTLTDAGKEAAVKLCGDRT